jgi:hypothetical protein
LFLLQLVVVLCKYKSQVGFDVLGQPHFHLRRYLAAPLAMAISDREEMTVLQTAKMGDCYPGILVSFVRVAGRLSCFCCECELGYAVCVHLLGVSGIETMLHVLKS